MPKIELDILIEDKRWLKIPRLRARLHEATSLAHAHLPKTLRIPCSASVLLTDDKNMHRLNRDFRGKDKPTNVLSFPQFESRKLTKMGKMKGSVAIGDVAMGYQYMVAECKKNHKILINHAVHLLIHGILHLFGYDHATDAETQRMERLEIRVMAGLGLPDPYASQPMEPKAR